MINRINRLRVITSVALASLLCIGAVDVSAATLVGKDLYSQNEVSIEIDGKSIYFNDPILNKGGNILLPMRDFYEAIQASVSWDKEAQTASSVKNGKTVDLTIDSTIAKVNGSNVSMNVAPMMYKDRTYVPLRFVSENLDGSVNWNQEEQKVEITLNDSSGTPPAPSEDPYVLHMNNKRIVMDDPVIIKEDRTYIPASYFYQYLENTSGTWLSKQDFELQIAGLIFIFSDQSNTVLVNQESVSMVEKPFIQSGEMYVPVHFLVNALGGSLNTPANKREIYIYLDHFMFVSDFLRKHEGATSRPESVPSARLEGTRSLLVSDNPETLTQDLVPTATATLAQQQIQSTPGTNEHRVFGWHVNKLETSATIAITIQNTSTNSSIEISDSKGYSKISGSSWNNYDVGLPIGDAVLNGRLKNSTSKGMIIKPGETKTIETYELYPNYMIGFLQDLDIRSIDGGTSDYTIRTVLAKGNEDVTTIHSDPVSIDEYAAHPRGAWPQSAIVADLPAYTVGSPEVGYNLSNGKTDHLLTLDNSLSTINGAVGNPGHFGMTYQVNIPIINTTGKAKNVKIKLAGRGGLYSGAVKMNGEVYLVPTLKPGTEYVMLPDYRVKGQTETISLEIMHAGGVNLPVAIYVEAE
ncbi:copper amine oxidase N-terminal domain-containing protein [Peribacillus loiseleuriae]|uniref:copper amine oxidase N-terminal domain-containing protein n=1 Tax=Peribacillus loiseleuriae TaxID=1679170 RepID=UPI00380B23D3